MKKQSQTYISLLLGIFSIGTFAVYGSGLIFGALGFWLSRKKTNNQLPKILSIIGISLSLIFLGFYLFFVIFARG